jgi:hypothetical protein
LSASAKSLLWIVAIVLMVVLFRPTAVVLGFGLIPTGIAFLFDRTPEKFAVFCIGSLNLAGLFPALMPLWLKGHTMENAVKAISDPITGAIIIGATGIGCLIYFAAPPIVSLVLKYRLGREIAELEQHQKDLIAYWGEALTEDAGLAPTSTPPALRHTPVRKRG